MTSGAWRRPYSEVFIDNGVPVTPIQSVIAASFAVGGPGLGAARLALWLWKLLSGPPVLEFCVPNARNPRVPGVKVYRVARMPVPSRVGIVPVTTPLRALLDTAAAAPELLQDAMVNGFIAKLVTPKAVESELARARTHGRRDWFQVAHDSGNTSTEILEAYRLRTSLLV